MDETKARASKSAFYNSVKRWLVSEYAHELNATEEGRDLVAGNFRVPRSEDEMARFHAFVIGTVNNHSFSVVATPPSQGTREGAHKLSGEELEELRYSGTINGSLVPPVFTRDDGAECFIAPEGEINQVDAEAQKDADEFGFDKQGNFDPLKGMSEERFDEVLEKSTCRTYQRCFKMELADDQVRASLNQTKCEPKPNKVPLPIQAHRCKSKSWSRAWFHPPSSTHPVQGQ